MTIRERQERDEEARLSPYAALSSRSAGRAHPISTCDLRTCYQRDRDRIIHCKSFRRLKYKTQVFLTPMGDHYRTRLTHTLEVSQVARTLARSLRLNEDLTEAAALGHDLGHTPFGHIGESTLNRLLPGGFRHNEQSLRVAERLENDGQGLNLCRETLDGILKPFELPRRCLSVLGETHGERIDTMIRDIVTTSMDQPFVRMSEEVRQASEELRAFLFEYVYHDEWRKKEEARCDYILSALYEHYLAHPEQLPAEYLEINFTEGAERAVCDFIACMTDRYAIDQFSEILVPGAFGRR